TAADDNRFRLAVSRGAGGERAYLLDWAGEAMRTTSLSMLQLQDENGRILSSGHFRNEFDRLEPELPRLLSHPTDKIAVVSARSPEGRFLAIARVDSFRIGDRLLTLVGGMAIDRALIERFARDGDVALSLVTPEGTFPPDSNSIVGARSVAAEQAL